MNKLNDTRNEQSLDRMNSDTKLVLPVYSINVMIRYCTVLCYVKFLEQPWRLRGEHTDISAAVEPGHMA